jgi:hypothetical protein
MNQPFDIPQAMQEPGSDAWRVLDVLSNRLLNTINQLDALESSQRKAEHRLEGGLK